MEEIISQILGEDLGNALLIILNLIIIESVLSVDNAVAIASYIRDKLPPHQHNKALFWGMWGAFIFRAICLFFAAWLMQIWWLKPLGGFYLIWITVDHFKDKLNFGNPLADLIKYTTLIVFLLTVQAEAVIEVFGINIDIFLFVQIGLIIVCLIFARKISILPGDAKDDSRLNRSNDKTRAWFEKHINLLVRTIIAVEAMDLAFSIDNVFAAVAFTDKIGLVVIGVIIGIITMRLVAKRIISLLNRYPFLEDNAFIIVLILGVKLALPIVYHSDPESMLAKIMGSKITGLIISIGTMSLFIVPIVKFEVSKWLKSKEKS